MQNAYMCCEGNSREAEHFIDCNVYMYYYRMWQKKQYSDTIAEKMKGK